MPATPRFPGYAVGDALPRVEVGASVFTDAPALADVRASFDAIRSHGDRIAVWDGGLFPEHRYTRVNLGDKGRARNHFQGVQRLRDGRHFVISGGDLNEPASHVFIGRMDSNPHAGPWGCNLLFSREPSLGDSVVRTIAFDRQLWHAGGLALLGDVLAIPIEGDPGSRIIFIDLSDPANPSALDIPIERPGRKAGAVALARVFDGRFVCAVWWEVGEKPKGRIDFYVSVSDRLIDGFHPIAVEWRFGAAIGRGDRDPAYQSVTFITQDGGGLFLVGTENASDKAPIFGGADRADLFEVQVGTMLDDRITLPRITLLRSRRLTCRNEFGNFDAACGLYLDPARGLHLYSAYHWRLDGLIRVVEFSASPEAGGDAVQDVERGWIELYEDSSFNGRRLTLRGRRHSHLDDYASILVEGGGFDDRVSSARFRIPAGQSYRLFRDARFRGDRAGKDFMDLSGTGQLVEIASLHSTGFGDQVSSSQYI